MEKIHELLKTRQDELVLLFKDIRQVGRELLPIISQYSYTDQRTFIELKTKIKKEIIKIIEFIETLSKLKSVEECDIVLLNSYYGAFSQIEKQLLEMIDIIGRPAYINIYIIKLSNTRLVDELHFLKHKYANYIKHCNRLNESIFPLVRAATIDEIKQMSITDLMIFLCTKIESAEIDSIIEDAKYRVLNEQLGPLAVTQPFVNIPGGLTQQMTLRYGLFPVTTFTENLELKGIILHADGPVAYEYNLSALVDIEYCVKNKLLTAITSGLNNRFINRYTLMKKYQNTNQSTNQSTNQIPNQNITKIDDSDFIFESIGKYARQLSTNQNIHKIFKDNKAHIEQMPHIYNKCQETLILQNLVAAWQPGVMQKYQQLNKRVLQVDDIVASFVNNAYKAFKTMNIVDQQQLVSKDVVNMLQTELLSKIMNVWNIVKTPETLITNKIKFHMIFNKFKREYMAAAGNFINTKNMTALNIADWFKDAVVIAAESLNREPNSLKNIEISLKEIAATNVI